MRLTKSGGAEGLRRLALSGRRLLRRADQGLMEQNQSEVEALYYSTLQSISSSLTSVQSNIDNLQSQLDA